jgi:hypothetical protein
MAIILQCETPLMKERHGMQQLKTRKPQRPMTNPAEPLPKVEFHTTVRSVPVTPLVHERSGIEPERFTVGPLSAAGDVIDITRDVIEIIAREVWRRDPQGNDLLNWMEAERLFHQAMTSRGRMPMKPLTTDAAERHGRD